MSRRYIVNVELKGEKIRVTLGYMREGSGHFVPLGDFENAQTAGHLATFVQEALHKEYERGLRDAYQVALNSLGKGTA